MRTSIKRLLAKGIRIREFPSCVRPSEAQPHLLPASSENSTQADEVRKFHIICIESSASAGLNSIRIADVGPFRNIRAVCDPLNNSIRVSWDPLTDAPAVISLYAMKGDRSSIVVNLREITKTGLGLHVVTVPNRALSPIVYVVLTL